MFQSTLPHGERQ